MPTTTNNRRAYIRRSLAIAWSFQRQSSFTSINVASTGYVGTATVFRKGASS